METTSPPLEAADIVVGAAGSGEDLQADLSRAFPTLRCAVVDGQPLHAVLQESQRLGAAACAIVDSGAPGWPERLLHPVLERGMDLVAPLYLRHKYDGALNTGILYPLMRALYGRRLRQPVGAEFALSKTLAARILAREFWQTEAGRRGADILIFTEAVAGGFKVGQAYLGRRPPRPAEAPSEPSDVLVEKMGPLYSEMEKRAAVWQRTRASEPVAVFGDPLPVDVEPTAIDVARMIEAFRIGHRNLQDVWGQLFPPATLVDLKRIARMPDTAFRIPDELWVKVIYDAALGHRLRLLPRDHVLRALAPLYLAWRASFILETTDAGAAEFEARLEKLCLAFESQKPYLISRWRWPDRFNP